MVEHYELVLVDAQGNESLLGMAKHPSEFSAITETPKYLGTWVNETTKVLRWNRGTLTIKHKKFDMKITSRNTYKIGEMPIYQLNVKFGGKLKSICINAHTIIGYDSQRHPLWQTSSFSKLADIVDKEMAWQVMQAYEEYLEDFGMQGSM